MYIQFHGSPQHMENQRCKENVTLLSRSNTHLKNRLICSGTSHHICKPCTRDWIKLFRTSDSRTRMFSSHWWGILLPIYTLGTSQEHDPGKSCTIQIELVSIALPSSDTTPIHLPMWIYKPTAKTVIRGWGLLYKELKRECSTAPKIDAARSVDLLSRMMQQPLDSSRKTGLIDDWRHPCFARTMVTRHTHPIFLFDIIQHRT